MCEWNFNVRILACEQLFLIVHCTSDQEPGAQYVYNLGYT